MKKILVLAMLFSVSAVFAEVLWEPATIRDFENRRPLKALEAGTYCSTRGCWVVGKKLLPADSTKRYRISCEVRAVDDAAMKNTVRIGVSPRDAKKRGAAISGLLPVAGTETEVVVPVKKEDKVIMVKDASKWKSMAARVVFDADPTGQLRDIPNFDFVSGRPVKYTRKGDAWEVTLNRPAGVELAVGTVVRQHRDARNAIFSNAKKLKKEWSAIEFVIVPGIAKNDTRSNMLFQGVAYIAPLLALPQNVEFRNFKIEVVE
jgi:hypothetical protein